MTWQDIGCNAQLPPRCTRTAHSGKVKSCTLLTSDGPLERRFEEVEIVAVCSQKVWQLHSGSEFVAKWAKHEGEIADSGMMIGCVGVHIHVVVVDVMVNCIGDEVVASLWPSSSSQDLSSSSNSTARRSTLPSIPVASIVEFNVMMLLSWWLSAIW